MDKQVKKNTWSIGTVSCAIGNQYSASGSVGPFLCVSDPDPYSSKKQKIKIKTLNSTVL
jgi:hypothetical protein